MQTAAALVSGVVGTLGIVAWGTHPSSPSPSRAWYLGSLLVGALAFVCGAMGLVGRALGVGGRMTTMLAGARVAWPSALLLGALPFAGRWPGAAGEWLPGILVLGAALVLAFRVHRRSPTRIPIVATLSSRRPGAWEFGLLGMSVVVFAYYLHLGGLAKGNLQNDSAYYFGVARHIALSGRIEEPIVWHLVNPPPHIIHAPFDYWGGLTPLVLAPVLAAFGATQHVAFIAMAAISGLSVVAFWYLVCVALPVRYRALQALTLLAFAFSPSAGNYRFDTESLPIHHCALIFALIGLATDRSLLAVCAGFLLVLNRIDGMVLFVGITVIAAICARGRPAQFRRVTTAAGGLLAVYLLRNSISFGALLPPGASAGIVMKDQMDLYTLHLPRVAPLDVLAEHLKYAYFVERIELFVDLLRSGEMVPAQPLWIALAALPGVAYFRGRGLTYVIPGAALGTAFFMVWASGPMVDNRRTLGTILPLIVLACGVGASASLDMIVAGTRRARRFGVVWPLLATTVVFSAAYPIASRIQPYAGRPVASMHSKEIELQGIDAMLHGAPVAATSAWYVMAQTRSPVVSLPGDGEASIAEVIRKYRIEWIVFPTPEFVPMRGSTPVLRQLYRGTTKTIGEFLLERVDTGGSLVVFRVVPR